MIAIKKTNYKGEYYFLPLKFYVKSAIFLIENLMFRNQI